MSYSSKNSLAHSVSQSIGRKHYFGVIPLSSVFFIQDMISKLLTMALQTTEKHFDSPIVHFLFFVCLFVEVLQSERNKPAVDNCVRGLSRQTEENLALSLI